MPDGEYGIENEQRGSYRISMDLVFLCFGEVSPHCLNRKER